MFDHDDLKWLAAHTTELNGLLQQVSRYSEHARQHEGERSYLDLLHDRVDLASRKSQELFDRVTSRILSGAGNGSAPTSLALNRIAAPTIPSHTNVAVKMPLGEIQEARAEKSRRPEIRNPLGARELVLLVDDDEDLLETTGAMLDFEDYRIVTAKTGPDALRIYREMGKEIALIILDYFLPVMDGDVVFDELKAIDPEVRVVLSSGFSEQAQLGNMLARGLRGFIPKPYTHEKLIDQIRLVLDA
jgi:CheY-like chemotaxis protein